MRYALYVLGFVVMVAGAAWTGGALLRDHLVAASALGAFLGSAYTNLVLWHHKSRR
jgi:hypothetical protein